MIEFTVPAMTCGNCVTRVSRAIADVDPNAQVKADLATKRVSIESTLTASDFVDALKAAGYPPVVQ